MNKENEKILEKVKLKMAISNFTEEEKIEMKKVNKKIYKTAAVACLAIFSITGVVFAKDIGNFIKNFFGSNTSDGIDTAVNNGYLAEVEAEVKSADGIQVEVDSFIIDDFNFAMNFKVTLDERYNINDFASVLFEDLRIIDEQENVVFSTNYNLPNAGTMEYEPEYRNGYSMLVNKTSENEFIFSVSSSGSASTFPRSKQLKISFTRMLDRKNNKEEIINKVYKGDWNFEVDVPKEFYNRETVIYKVKSCSDDKTVVQNAVLSNTGFKIYITSSTTDKVDYDLLHNDNPKSIFDKIAFQKEYVKTSNGKKFEPSRKSDGDGGYGVPAGENRIIDYHQTFNLTKYDATDELTVYIFTNKKEKIKIKFEKMQ